MAKLWSTKDLLRWDKREILFWHHRLNHCSLKSLLGLSKRGVILKKLVKVKKLPPCVSFLFGKSHNRPWRTKVKQSGVSIRNALEKKPGAMKSID